MADTSMQDATSEHGKANTKAIEQDVSLVDLLSAIQSMNNDIQAIKQDVQAVKEDVLALRGELHEIEEHFDDRLKDVKDRFADVDNRPSDLEAIGKSISDGITAGLATRNNVDGLTPAERAFSRNDRDTPGYTVVQDGRPRRRLWDSVRG